MIQSKRRRKDVVAIMVRKSCCRTEKTTRARLLTFYASSGRVRVRGDGGQIPRTRDVRLGRENTEQRRRKSKLFESESKSPDPDRSCIVSGKFSIFISRNFAHLSVIRLLKEG